MKKFIALAALAAVLLVGCGDQNTVSSVPASGPVSSAPDVSESVASAPVQEQVQETAQEGAIPVWQDYDNLYIANTDPNAEPGSDYYKIEMTAEEEVMLPEMLPAENWQETEAPAQEVTELFWLEGSNNELLLVSALDDSNALITAKIKGAETAEDVMNWTVPANISELEEFTTRLLERVQ